MERLQSFWRSAPTWQKVLLAGSALLTAHQLYQAIKPKKNLVGEIVVITGGGSGIGRLLAMKLAQHGCRLALWDIDEKAAEAVAKEIHADTRALYGTACKAYGIDITNRKRVYALAERVKADFGGPVDILVNNAGIVTGKGLLETSDERISKLFEVNAISHFWTIKAFLPSMIERDHGHIVTIASAAGITGVPGLVDYCASKFAAVGTAESLRGELRKLGKRNVISLCVCPYYIKTGMFEGVKTYSMFLPLLEPEYVVNKIVQSIKEKDDLLCLPRFIYLSRATRGLVSGPMWDAVCETYGISRTMDDFVQTRPT